MFPSSSPAAKPTFNTALIEAMQFPSAHVDRVLHDGDTVAPRRHSSHRAPHRQATPGAQPRGPSMNGTRKVHGRILHVVIVGSPNVNPGYKLVGNKAYPQIASDYKHGFAVLEELALRHFSRRARRLLRPH